MRMAGPGDVTRLVELMVEFYAESGHPCDAVRAATAFDELVRDPRLGRVWLLEQDGRAVGYAVLTLGYSLDRAAHREHLLERRGRAIARLQKWFDPRGGPTDPATSTSSRSPSPGTCRPP